MDGANIDAPATADARRFGRAANLFLCQYGYATGSLGDWYVQVRNREAHHRTARHDSRDVTGETAAILDQ